MKTEPGAEALHAACKGFHVLVDYHAYPGEPTVLSGAFISDWKMPHMLVDYHAYLGDTTVSSGALVSD